jgi:hypothetical protein
MNANDSIIDKVVQNVFNGNVLKDSQFSSQIFTVFIFVGLFTHIVFSGIYSKHGTYGPATALVWGYTIVFFSIVMIIYYNNQSSRSNDIFKIVDIETLLLLFYILWLISLNANNMKKINSNNLPRNYFSYSYMTSIIIALQTLLFIFFTTIKANNIQSSEKEKGIISNIKFINYIFTFLNFMLIIIQQIILDNFSVDML